MIGAHNAVANVRSWHKADHPTVSIESPLIGAKRTWRSRMTAT
jgi:hypothetical protein